MTNTVNGWDVLYLHGSYVTVWAEDHTGNTELLGMKMTYVQAETLCDKLNGHLKDVLGK